MRCLAAVIAAILVADAAGKNVVVFSDLCKLSLTLKGTVLLSNASCCLGYVRPINYVCPYDSKVNSDVSFTTAVQQYLVDCDNELPASIVIAKTEGDVVKTLTYATNASVDFRVKSGGHNQACLSTVKNGLVLSLQEMKEIDYMTVGDEVYMTLQSGVTISQLHTDYLANTDVYFPHGLDPWIGAGGHLTGGGVGHLIRKFGFGSDYVVGMDIVLPGGEFVQVFEPEYEEELTGHLSVYNQRDKDLLWGMKGSGHANFGVATKFYMRTIKRPAYIVLGERNYILVDKTSFEVFWSATCDFYWKSPENETAAERNLLVWPTISQDMVGVFRLKFTIYYIPDNNSTAQGALDEATPAVDAYFANVGLTLVSGTLEAVEEGNQYPNLANDLTFSRTAYTCVARAIRTRAEVCDNTYWITDIFSEFMQAEASAFPTRGSTFFSYFDVWGGAAALIDPEYERTSINARNAFGTLQFCTIPLSAATNRTALVYGEGGTKDFNDTVLAHIGDMWYINFIDVLVTEPEHVYSVPAVYQRLKTVKQSYDPTNVLERPLGVPLPVLDYLEDNTVLIGGASGMPSFTEMCELSILLKGTVLLPGGLVCCGDVAMPDVVPCTLLGINANLSYTASHEVVMLDCDAYQPEAFVIARTQNDVMEALNYVKERGIDYRIRSGGHSGSCASACKDCMVISLEEMKDIEYVTSDSGSTFIGIEPGVRLSEIVSSYQTNTDVYFPHGLDAPVGIGGHLGGGAVGLMTRKFGFGCDFIVGVELILGNGKFVQVYDSDYEEEMLGYRRAYNDEDQDLLWAIRGNSHASVGVVTRYWMRTVPRPTYMVQGSYTFQLESKAHIYNFWGSVCKFYSVTNESPLAKNLIIWPFIRSDKVLRFTVYYLPDHNSTAAGAMAEAQPLLQEFLSGVSAPFLSEEISAVEDGNQFASMLSADPSRVSYSCTSRLVMNRSDVCDKPAFLESFVDRLWDEISNPEPYQLFWTYFDPWGGAASSNDPEFVKTSFMGRNAWGTFQYCRVPLAESVSREHLWAAVDDFSDSIATNISDVWYVNFQDRTTPSRFQTLHIPEVTDRLHTIKERYDSKGVIGGPFSVTLPERGW